MPKRYSNKAVDQSVLDNAIILSYSVHPKFSKCGIYTIRIRSCKDGKEYLLYPEYKAVKERLSTGELGLLLGISIQERFD